MICPPCKTNSVYESDTFGIFVYGRKENERFLFEHPIRKAQRSKFRWASLLAIYFLFVKVRGDVDSVVLTIEKNFISRINDLFHVSEKKADQTVFFHRKFWLIHLLLILSQNPS